MDGSERGRSSPSTWNPTTDEWQIYGLSHPLRNYINDLFIADNQDKWLPIDLDRGGGVLVFNEVENVTRYLNTNGGQGGLPEDKLRTFNKIRIDSFGSLPTKASASSPIQVSFYRADP